MKTLHVVPAYGRDYASAKEAGTALACGQDFQIRDVSSPWNGAYMSVRDMEPGDTVVVRYRKLTSQVSFRVGQENGRGILRTSLDILS